MGCACKQVHERADSFRAQIGSLDIICRLYNNIYRTLLPVEKPLIQGKLDALGSALHKGLTVRSLLAALAVTSHVHWQEPTLKCSKKLAECSSLIDL